MCVCEQSTTLEKTVLILTAMVLNIMPNSLKAY